MSHHYHFDCVWQVPRPLDEAFETLAAVGEYPRWWRQVRSVRQVADDSVDVVIRSTLPVPMSLTLTRQVRDASTGVLRVGITGDLVGWAEWQLTWEGATTSAARWTQEVDLTHPRLRQLPDATIPVLRLNHARMMRAGEAGLRRWLAEGHAP